MKNVLMTVLMALAFLSANAQEKAPLPSDYFGYEPGSDRKLFTYEELISYMQKLDQASDRIAMEQIGSSPMGRPMYIVFISSAKNIAALSQLKLINRELALNPELAPSEKERMIKDGKVFILATLSMHSSEVGPSQAAPLIAYDLATTQDSKKLEWLDNVVYMIVPNHNPDGMDLVVTNYKKNVGTKYEGATLPGVYHKYVGHDNNRDFVILSQEDTKAIARISSQTWFPQVMVEKHQMSATGTRYFVPPNHDPLTENVDAGLFTWGGLFGQNMVNDMTAAGQAGVSQHYSFDNYWPGSTQTCLWQNVIAMLTECASAKDATPIYVEPSELRVNGKGLAEYKKSTNMLMPWEGGWWRLGDIVAYELTSTMSIIKTASLYREDILRFRNDICIKEVNRGRTEAPYYYIMPRAQEDQGELVGLVSLLKEQGIRVYTLDKDMILDGRSYLKGDVVVPLAQPFRPMVKEFMEKQKYPERHYTINGPLIKPYDITSWSLPLHRNIKAWEIELRSKELEASLVEITGNYSLAVPIPDDCAGVLLPVTNNASFALAFEALQKGYTLSRLPEDLELDGQLVRKGSFYLPFEGKNASAARALAREMQSPVIPVNKNVKINSSKLELPRIALVESWYHDMDAGWTRFVLDSYHIPFTLMHPEDFGKADLTRYDIIIFADEDKDILMSGKRKSGENYYMGSYRPEYTQGIEKEGFDKLMSFLDQGGIILSWGGSVKLFEGMLTINHEKDKEEFTLPFREISSSLSTQGLDVTGSLLKLDLLRDHPLTLGLGSSTAVFSRGTPVFQTSVPQFDMDRRVIGSYAKEDVLLSGYAGNGQLLEGKSAMIWMKKGKGQLVLYGFSPQFRASTQASYKLLFNALLLEKN